MAGVDEVQVVCGIDDALVDDAAEDVLGAAGVHTQHVVGGQPPLAGQVAAGEGRVAMQCGHAGQPAGAAVAPGVAGIAQHQAAGGDVAGEGGVTEHLRHTGTCEACAGIEAQAAAA